MTPQLRASIARLLAPVLFAIAGACLTACGGGSDDEAGTPVVGPQSAASAPANASQ